MNILVIGGGGREHAVVKALKQNKKVEKIYALPGNGGIAREEGAECFPVKATDLDGIVAFAKSHKIDRIKLRRLSREARSIPKTS